MRAGHCARRREIRGAVLQGWRGFLMDGTAGYFGVHMRRWGACEGKKRGTFRREGKTYIVEDGDVINFLFNV